MLMYLEASDPDYIDRINDGPYLPRKIVPQIATEPEQFIIKEKSEWSPEDKIEDMKDVKVKTILHNSLDHVMSNRGHSLQKQQRKSGMLWKFNVKAQRRSRRTEEQY